MSTNRIKWLVFGLISCVSILILFAGGIIYYMDMNRTDVGGSHYSPAITLICNIEEDYYNITIYDTSSEIYQDKIGWGIVDDNRNYYVEDNLPTVSGEDGKKVGNGYVLIWFDANLNEKMDKNDFYHLFFTPPEEVDLLFCMFLKYDDGEKEIRVLTKLPTV